MVLTLRAKARAGGRDGRGPARAADEQLAAPLAAAVPRLGNNGGPNLAALARAGWTPGDVAALGRAWPTLNAFSLVVLVAHAQNLVEALQASPAETITWLGVLLEVNPRFASLLRVRPEIHAAAGPDDDYRGLARDYMKAAGSRELGLLAAAAGLSLAELDQRAAQGSLEPDALRAAATARGIVVP